ncbi:MAG: hypothetical protein IKP40_02680 [Clostridia bacterium]|nr:hypothetical protein [Clostridia bacterium]
MEWSDKNGSLLDSIAVAVLRDKELLSAACCDKPEIHIHAHSIGFWKERGRGSAWIWCSHCGTFSHLDGIPISSDWENNPDVDFSQVCAVPVYLETVKDAVDQHLKEFLDK